MKSKYWIDRAEKRANSAYGLDPAQEIELLKANALIAIAAALADVAEAIKSAGDKIE